MKYYVIIMINNEVVEVIPNVPKKELKSLRNLYILAYREYDNKEFIIKECIK